MVLVSTHGRAAADDSGSQRVAAPARHDSAGSQAVAKQE